MVRVKEGVLVATGLSIFRADISFQSHASNPSGLKDVIVAASCPWGVAEQGVVPLMPSP